MAQTVTVACKLPNGLILRTFVMEEQSEPVMGGGTRTVKRARETGEQVKIEGVAAPFGVPKMLANGYALTPGVDAAFFAAWLEQNAESPLVTSGVIFAHERSGMVEGEAKEKAKVKTGLEPLSQKNDPRAPKRIEKAEAA